MAMTKTEKERMDRLEKAVALARSMRWPEYPEPAPMTQEEKKAALVDGGTRYGQIQRVARGWFHNSHSKTVTYGCSDGIGHSPTGDTTSSQGAGLMFATKVDALRAMRLEMTERYAEELAKVDAEIQDAL